MYTPPTLFVCIYNLIKFLNKLLNLIFIKSDFKKQLTNKILNLKNASLKLFFVQLNFTSQDHIIFPPTTHPNTTTF